MRKAFEFQWKKNYRKLLNKPKRLHTSTIYAHSACKWAWKLTACSLASWSSPWDNDQCQVRAKLHFWFTVVVTCGILRLPRTNKYTRSATRHCGLFKVMNGLSCSSKIYTNCNWYGHYFPMWWTVYFSRWPKLTKQRTAMPILMIPSIKAKRLHAYTMSKWCTIENNATRYKHIDRITHTDTDMCDAC